MTGAAGAAPNQPRPDPVDDVFNPPAPRIIDERIDPAVEQAIDAGQTVDVVVELDRTLPDRAAEVAKIKAALGVEQARDLGGDHVSARRLDKAALARLKANRSVVRIQAETLMPRAMSDVQTIVGTGALNTAGFNGTNRVVVVLDTGIAHTNPDITSAVIGEACFSIATDCGGTTSQIGGAAAQHGTTSMSGWDHGTLTAAEIASRNAGLPGTSRGVGLVVVKVSDPAGACGHCFYDTPVLNGLNWVNSQIQANGTWQGTGKPVDAISMSIGGGNFAGYCDSNVHKAPIDNMLAKGVPTIIAAGNEGNAGGIGTPGCISSAVTIGATTKTDGIASFTNRGPALDFYAPGVNINTPHTVQHTVVSVSGTSMSTPVFAGMLSSLAQKFPTASKTQLLDRLKRTGVNIDGRVRPNASAVTLDAKFVPISPKRILDSDWYGARVNSGYWGTGNAMAVLGTQPSQVAAVQLNVTVVGPTGGGYLNVWQGGISAPAVSMLQAAAGTTVPLSVTVKPNQSSGDSWMNWNGSGDTRVLVDLVGYWPNVTLDNPYNAIVSPGRIGDSRYNIGGMGTIGLAPGGVFNLQVSGQGGVVPNNVDSAMLNITALGASQAGLLAVVPSGAAWNGTSNINFDAYETIAGQVFSKLGSNGKVAIVNGGPSYVHVIVDVHGYTLNASPFGPLIPPMTAMTPVRVLDSRTGAGTCSPSCFGKFSAGAGPRHVQVAGVGGIPAGARSVAVNLTGANVTTQSFLAAYAGVVPYPGHSNLNPATFDTTANMAWIGLDQYGRMQVYGEGSADAIVDVMGYAT